LGLVVHVGVSPADSAAAAPGPVVEVGAAPIGPSFDATAAASGGGLVDDVDLFLAHVRLDYLLVLDDVLADAQLLLDHGALLDHYLFLDYRHHDLVVADLYPRRVPGDDRHLIDADLLAR
jgi:hypothetical protein